MGSRAAQALLVAATLLVSGTAFGLGSKGGGMEEKKDTGMMQDEKAVMEKTGGTMPQETMQDAGTKTMDEKKPMQGGDTMMKGTDEKSGMEKKEPMR